MGKSPELVIRINNNLTMALVLGQNALFIYLFFSFCGVKICENFVSFLYFYYVFLHKNSNRDIFMAFREARDFTPKPGLSRQNRDVWSPYT
jgi:hypothetical protein